MSDFADPIAAAMLRPFHDQSIEVGSMVAVGCPPWLTLNKGIAGGSSTVAHDETVLLRLRADRGGDARIVERVPMQPSSASHVGEPAHTPGRIAKQARDLLGDSAGEMVLLSPAHVLSNMIVRGVENIGFCAIVILASQSPGEARSIWKLQRTLFDSGLVAIGSVQVADCEARCFLSSDSFDLSIVSALGHAGTLRCPAWETTAVSPINCFNMPT